MNARILIVEDEAITVEDLRYLLTCAGHTVVGVAASGEKAVEMVEQTRPEVVLMDIRLKGDMDGVDAARQIHDRFDASVVYLTAHADDAMLQRAKTTEPCGYVLKPIRERELLANIEVAHYKAKMVALRKRERELTDVLNSLDQGLIAFNDQGYVSFMNSLAEAIIGAGPAELHRMKADDILNLISRKTNLQNAQATPIPLPQIPIRDKDGNTTGNLVILRIAK